MHLSTQHIDIHVNDLQKAQRFYTEVLGFSYLFTPVGADDAPIELVWLANNEGVVIELTREKDGYDAEAANRASRTHVALRTPDIDAALARLKEAGATIELGPVPLTFTFDQPLPARFHSVFAATDGSSATMRIAFFRGPSGERFELVQDDLS